MSTPTADQRLRALCVKMKIAADDRLFDQRPVEFDPITAIEKEVESLTIHFAGCLQQLDAETRARRLVEQNFDIARERTTAAEGKLTAIRSALGIPEPRP